MLTCLTILLETMQEMKYPNVCTEENGGNGAGSLQKWGEGEKKRSTV